MAAPALGFGSICTTSRTNSLHLSLSSNPSNLLSFFSPRPCRFSLCAAASRPTAAFSTVVKSAESAAPVLEAESLAEVEPESSSAVEPSEAAEPTAPEPKREEIYAVVMVGSRQYIVFPGRWIHTQRLKDANVNDKIILNKVLLVGTKNSTYIGKPVVTNAAVHAVVEQQLLDDKVVVFKYKSKKKYRRNIGHRQPITRIRVTGITGYEDYPAS